MKVNRKAGTRNSWQEMDIESRQAVYLAELTGSRQARRGDWK